MNPNVQMCLDPVYNCETDATDEIVALKRLKMEKEKDGFPITSLREINTLLKAQHINIVTVRVCHCRGMSPSGYVTVRVCHQLVSSLTVTAKNRKCQVTIQDIFICHDS